MSICIPAASCGVAGTYSSAERAVDFLTDTSGKCIISSADYTAGALGSDCSSDTDGCSTGLSCAIDLDDGAGND